MRMLGQWIEDLRETEFVAPHELVGEYPDGVQRVVADYLDEGEIFAPYREAMRRCLFPCDQLCSSTLLTDGSWAWPISLSHYVRDHSVLLPREFTQHAMAGLPHTSWEREAALDFTFWINWCRANASGHLKSTIQSARERAEEEAEEILSELAKERENEVGLDDSICIWANCSNQCLAGTMICARCSLKGTPNGYVLHVFGDVRSVINESERIF